VRANRETEYLNVDLDITSRRDLQPLVSALGRRVFVLHVDGNGRHSAGLEVAAMTRTADRTIRRFATLVKSLPPRARTLWNRARSRDLNIGIQAGHDARAFTCLVGPDAVRAAAEIGARIVITVYGSALGDARREKGRARRTAGAARSTARRRGR
jgi:hypothetical protein